MGRASPAWGKQAINGSIIIFLSFGDKWIIFCFGEPKSREIRRFKEAERVVI